MGEVSAVPHAPPTSLAFGFATLPPEGEGHMRIARPPRGEERSFYRLIISCAVRSGQVIDGDEAASDALPVAHGDKQHPMLGMALRQSRKKIQTTNTANNAPS